jgi:hypothetical protein
MENVIKKGSIFAKEVLARLKGDDAKAIAEKNARKAMSAVEGQLAALKAKEVDLENTLEDAQENLANAKYPTDMITDNQNYIRNIKKAQEMLDNAEQDLKDVKDSINYFDNLLKSF